MTWKAAVPQWVIRVIGTMMLGFAVQVLLGGPGWEQDFDPPLSAREQKLVRSGVLFEMCFQTGLWVTALVANELGNSRVRGGLLLTMCLTMLFCGPYGLPTWLHYGDGEDDPKYKQDIISEAVTVCYVVCAVMAASSLLAFTAGDDKGSKKD